VINGAANPGTSHRRRKMITVTRLNDKEVVVNCETILLVEANPDTTITTTTGLKIIVKESVEDIVAKTKEYKKYIHTNI